MGLDPQVEHLLEQMQERKVPSFEQLSVPEARALLSTFSEMQGDAEPVGQTGDITIPGPDGDIAARVYRPKLDGPLPILMHFHGGGFVLGDLDSVDKPSRMLANRIGCIVVSVDYRLAPEHPYPAATEDCYAATAWMADNATQFGGRGDVLAVAGDSAGGNLAAVVCLMARDRGGPPIALQILIYPATQVDADTYSRTDNAEGYLWTRDAMEWFEEHYAADPNEPYASPLVASDLIDLPPAIVVTAEFDPLRDEGDDYADRLHADGVDVLHITNDGMIHGFMWLGGMIDHTHAVYDQIGDHAKAVLGSYILNTP